MARTLILGLGRFGGGREAAAFLARRGEELRIHDQAAPETLADSIAALAAFPIEWRLGPAAADPETLLAGIDRVLVNPAIPDAHPVLAQARARGIATTQEVDLFLAAYPGRTVLVTGTNGKSTTTVLLHRMLVQSGCDALVGGNLGHSLLADETRWQREQIAVLEISSFQLERLAPGLTVTGSVLTRITRDHLDRHGDLATYQRAKSVAAVRAREFVVHGQDDPVAAGFASPARTRWTFGVDASAPARLGRRDGWLLLPDGRPLLHRAALRLLGDYDLENVQAAAAAALALGATPHPVAVAAVTCDPLPFRLQLRTTLDGVRVYDNAVSTDVLSTEAAMRSLGEPVHWVGGGKSKDGDFRRVAALLAPHLASAHLFGAAAAALQPELAQTAPVPVTVHTDLAAALGAAMAAARPGSAVLFSPGFASYDQFLNFRARGLAFHAALDALARVRPGLQSRPAVHP